MALAQDVVEIVRKLWRNILRCIPWLGYRMGLREGIGRSIARLNQERLWAQEIPQNCRPDSSRIQEMDYAANSLMYLFNERKTP